MSVCSSRDPCGIVELWRNTHGYNVSFLHFCFAFGVLGIDENRLVSRSLSSQQLRRRRRASSSSGSSRCRGSSGLRLLCSSLRVQQRPLEMCVEGCVFPSDSLHASHGRATRNRIFRVLIPLCRILPRGVGSHSITANAHRETHKCKHDDSQMCTEPFTRVTFSFVP